MNIVDKMTVDNMTVGCRPNDVIQNHYSQND